MKTVYSCLIILIFFTSCTDETILNSQVASTKEAYKRKHTELPGNSSNPYDEAGWIHSELFETYYESVSKPATVAGVIAQVEAIADSNSNFKSITATTYSSVSAEQIQYFLDHSTTCVPEVIAKSSLSSIAKLSLSSFIQSLDEKFVTEASCDVLYTYLVAYEKTILNSATFTTRDKEVMLTTTSIARHSVYLAKKKPKKNTNPDWTILILHITGAIEGAEHGMAESVTEGLVAGIVSN